MQGNKKRGQPSSGRPLTARELSLFHTTVGNALYDKTQFVPKRVKDLFTILTERDRKLSE